MAVRNVNLPKDVLILYEKKDESGTTVYFVNRDGDMFSLSDGYGFPKPAYFTEIFKETGLTPSLIDGMYSAWERYSDFDA